MTKLLAETYGWAVPPVAPMIPDEERYAGYRSSAIFDDVCEKSAGDLALYDFVRNYELPKAPEKSEEPSRPIEIRPAVPACPICGVRLESVGEKGECLACKSPARTRSLPPVLDGLVGPALAHTDRDLPLLAFAATGAEKTQLKRHFEKLCSVSLFGKYGNDHISGVDVRDLSRFADASFSGAFGILLFDYFPEHEKALHELSRVVAPGGILFTLILPSRILPDASAPVVTRKIQPRAGYFEYIPEGGELLNIHVGQDWLLGAIARAGFAPRQMRVPDPVTDEISQWFIGIRQTGPAPVFAGMEPEVRQAEPPQPAAPSPVAPAAEPAAAKPVAKPARPPGRGPSLTNQTRMTDGFTREFVTPLEGFGGLKSIAVKLTVPSVPFAGRSADFAEHRWLLDEKRSSNDVACVGPGMIMVSGDLGEHWNLIEVPELAGKTPNNHFTTSTGARLVQLAGWNHADAEKRPDEDWGAILRLDAQGTFLDRSQNSGARWHGPRAIGERDGVILYSDYFDNAMIGTLKPGTEEWKQRLRSCHVWRSDDDGKSWRSIFEKDPTQIRHFHFVMPDSYAPKTWWLSSGDRPRECHCWRSDDNGETWIDVTNSAPDIALHPLGQRSKQAAFRATDMAILPDTLIWGTDDLLIFNDEYRLVIADPEKQKGVPFPGSRVFAAAKDGHPLQPRDLGLGGHPFRNFVDVGPGYLAFTEAKYEPIGFEPVVYFVGKAEPHRVQRLFSIPSAKGKGSGFSYSRASMSAVNGRFFSFRGSGDLVQLVPRLLQWDVAFA
jgi:hypothetical protein